MRFFLDENGWLWDRDDMSEAVMSDREANSNRKIMENAKGNVLLFGLGIGFILPAILDNPNVTAVTVVELHQEVIDLISYPAHPKLTIVQGDAFTSVIDGEFDTIWFDLWTTGAEDKTMREAGIVTGDSREFLVNRWLPQLAFNGYIDYWKKEDHWPTPYGYYMKSDLASLPPVFEKYVTGKKFLDLGAGTGEVVALASEYTDRALGIEADVTMTAEPRNFIEEDLISFDVVYYFLYGSNREIELKEKLKTFNGIALIHFHTLTRDTALNFCDGATILEEFNKTMVVQWPHS